MVIGVTSTGGGRFYVLRAYEGGTALTRGAPTLLGFTPPWAV